MNNNTRCPNCNAQLKRWKHTLTPGLFEILLKCIRAVHRKGVNEFHLQDDLNLTKNEYNNAQKLRYHALIAKSDRKGYWVITTRGGQFLRGEIAIPDKVFTFRNKVEGHSETLIGRDDFRNRIKFLETDFDFDIVNGMVVPFREPARLFS